MKLHFLSVPNEFQKLLLQSYLTSVISYTTCPRHSLFACSIYSLHVVAPYPIHSFFLLRAFTCHCIALFHLPSHGSDSAAGSRGFTQNQYFFSKEPKLSPWSGSVQIHKQHWSHSRKDFVSHHQYKTSINHPYMAGERASMRWVVWVAANVLPQSQLSGCFSKQEADLALTPTVRLRLQRNANAARQSAPRKSNCKRNQSRICCSENMSSPEIGINWNCVFGILDSAHLDWALGCST